MTKPEAQKPTTPKAPAARSPNYPYVDLRRAVDLAFKFYEKFKVHPTPEKLAAECWGYSAKSSGSQRVIGALSDFGLVSIKQNPAPVGREISITERGRKVFLKAEGYEKILGDMALSPQIYKDLWQKYGSDIPPQALIEQYLIFTKKFNDDSAKHVAGSFKRTIDFANPSKMNKLEENEEDGGEDNGNADEDSDNPAKSEKSKSSQTEIPKGFSPPKINMTETQEMKFPLSKGKEAVLYVPKEMKGKDFALLLGYLKLAEDASTANEEEEIG